MSKMTLPIGWKTMKLGKLFTERIETNCSDFNLLSVTGTSGIVPRTEIKGKDNSSKNKSKYLKVCKGDIAYNTMRMWQGVSALSEFEGIVSPAYTVLIPSDSVCAKYFSYLFKLQYMIFRFYRNAQGIVDDTRNLKYKNFAKISVPLPPLAEQRAIAEIFTEQDKLIAVKERFIDAKQKQKKWLMQNLLKKKWKSVKLKTLFEKSIAKNNGFTYSLVLTNSAQNGIIPQIDHFNKDIAVDENIDGYYIVNDGEFVYNPRISVSAPCGPIRCNHLGETGVMSPLSKRNANYILTHGIIPCSNSGKKTRQFKVQTKDIVRYLEEIEENPGKYVFPSFSSGVKKERIGTELPTDKRFFSMVKSYYNQLLDGYSDLLSVQDAAHIIGYSRKTVDKWIRAEKLMVIKKSRFLVPKSVLLNFVSDKAFVMRQPRSAAHNARLKEILQDYYKYDI